MVTLGVSPSTPALCFCPKGPPVFRAARACQRAGFPLRTHGRFCRTSLLPSGQGCSILSVSSWLLLLIFTSYPVLARLLCRERWGLRRHIPAQGSGWRDPPSAPEAFLASVAFPRCSIPNTLTPWTLLGDTEHLRTQCSPSLLRRY